MEQLKRKLEYCQEYEKNRIQQFNEQSLAECHQWRSKIEKFQFKIREENQRSSKVESGMCAEIQVSFRQFIILIMAREKKSAGKDSVSRGSNAQSQSESYGLLANFERS